MSDATTAAAELSPESRQLRRASGHPVSIAGADWLLPAFVPTPDAAWDRVFDANCLADSYDPADVRSAAVRLLWANYDLTPDEAVGLARAADLAELVAAVELALLGPADNYRTYSDWVLSALWSNGIDPDTVPGPVRRLVLDQLVITGRAAPAAKFVSAAEAAARLSRLP